jgi:hypothetical protein
VASSARAPSGRDGVYSKKQGHKPKPPAKLKPMQRSMSVREVFATGSQQQQAGLVVAVARDRDMKAEELAEVLDAASATVSFAESALGDAESSLGDAESSLGDAEGSLGDAEGSLGDR